MGVQIHIQGSPRKDASFECQCVEEGKPWDKCYMCQGTGKVAYEEDEWPWMDMSNASARAVFVLLSIPHEREGIYGELDPVQLAFFRQKILKVLNLRRALESAIQEPYQEGNFVECGLDEDRLRYLLGRLDQVFAKAQSEEAVVAWG